MPIYEYRCCRCGVKFEKLLFGFSDIFCPVCRTKDVERILSRVIHHRTEEDRLSELDLSRPLPDSFYRDDRNIGLTAKKRLKQMGVDLGDAFEERIEKARTKKILEES